MNRGTFASIIAALGFIMFFVLVMPQYDLVKISRETVSAREALLNERASIIAKIKELTQMADKRRGDIDRLSTFMPRGKKLDEVISSLEKIAADSGLRLSQITTSDTAAFGENAQKKLLISFDLSGTYPNFVGFLKLLEQNLRLYDVSEIIISPITSTGTGGLNFALKMYAYYLD